MHCLRKKKEIYFDWGLHTDIVIHADRLENLDLTRGEVFFFKLDYLNPDFTRGEVFFCKLDYPLDDIL